jgi:hypothetical protein
MAYDNFLIDKRVVQRNIAKGLVDPQVYKQLVEALPDSESNCVRVSLDGEPIEEGAEAQAQPQAEAEAGEQQPSQASEPSAEGGAPQVG